MAALWPSPLMEKVLEQGFDLRPGSTTIETEMDIGLPKKRRRYTKGIDEFSVTIHLEQSDYTTFRNFYDTTLNGGVGTFLFDHPITQVESEFQFVGEPRISSLGGTYFILSMVWRLIP